jgi:hypothetical protein
MPLKIFKLDILSKPSSIFRKKSPALDAGDFFLWGTPDDTSQ